MGTTADAQASSDRGRNRSRGASSNTEPSGGAGAASHLVLNRPYAMNDRTTTLPVERQQTGSVSPIRAAGEEDAKERATVTKPTQPTTPTAPVRCINPSSEVNSRLDTQVEVRVYPCNNSQSSSGKKKFTTFTVKPEVSRKETVVLVVLCVLWIPKRH